MGCFRVLRRLPLSLSITAVAKPQKLSRNVEIAVIRTPHDISRTETLIYLRVFSDVLAEGHSTAKVDRRELALKQSQVPPNDLAKLEFTLKPSNTKNLESKYEPYWGKQRLRGRMGNHNRTRKCQEDSHLDKLPTLSCATEKAAISGRD